MTINKNLLILIITAAFIQGIFFIHTAPVSGATISHSNVKVRVQPNTKSDSPWKLQKGELVIILDVGQKASIGKWGSHHWYYVTYSPSFDTFWDGWIFGAFISTKISGDRVRLRSKPTTKGSKILAQLKKNTSVTILKTPVDKKNNSGMNFPEWYFVKIPSGKTGWVSAEYVK
ncbi:MAG: SH3 domain-containing protein [bacterium]|nr:SH3 domain-containing protein [bacterium]